MTNNSDSRPHSAVGMVFGGALVLAGILFLVLQLLNLDFSFASTLWPLLILVPGLFFFGLAFVNDEGEHFAILGSIFSVLSLLLFFQNTTGHWENWAYTWALLIPTSCGLGQILYGLIKQRSATVKTGIRLTSIGAMIFLVGFFFFEVVLGIGGFPREGLLIARYGWPISLVGLGAILILNYLLGNPIHRPPRQDSMK